MKKSRNSIINEFGRPNQKNRKGGIKNESKSYGRTCINACVFRNGRSRVLNDGRHYLIEYVTC